MPEPHLTPGGGFLYAATPTIFVPEQRSPQQEMMAQSVDRFLAAEVEPHYAEFEAQAPGVATRFMAGLGELGVLGVEIPERYGGLGLGL
ncbi:MAG: acyl-CoA dehydrogenase family protein, partial [Deltaproteobacteria bacterium]|nr:acyl-CoA dehydrogenase family protein [Deltaproteobacteria bacterium]